jgi:flagellar biosynthesis protein FliQ
VSPSTILKLVEGSLCHVLPFTLAIITPVGLVGVGVGLFSFFLQAFKAVKEMATAIKILVAFFMFFICTG